MKGVLGPLAFLALLLSSASASDPSPLQDFCVATNDPKNAIFVNGMLCKSSEEATADDFFASGLNVAGNTTNRFGSNVTALGVNRIPGLNTLGISLVRIDYAPGGQNPPHTHPRGTEILVLVEGTLHVGFVSSNQDGNRLFIKTLYPGDVFVFPVGLIHFQLNARHKPAVAFAALNSQNAGVITIANSIFGSTPDVDANVLSRAFQLDKHVVKYLQTQF